MVDAKTKAVGEGESVAEMDALISAEWGLKKEKTARRLQRETAAARSPAQRERSRTRKSTSINFRTTKAVKDAAQAIMKKRGLKSIAPIVEEAIVTLAKAEGIDT